jgi:hypothetical protein
LIKTAVSDLDSDNNRKPFRISETKMKPLQYTCHFALFFTILMTLPIRADHLQHTRIEIGPIGGYVLTTGRPGIRSALFGGGYVGLHIWRPLWIVAEAGMVPTSSNSDQTFTINLFYARGAVKIEWPMRKGLRSFMFLGGGLIEFDPAGQVDAEDALWRWSADGGFGVTYPLHHRLSIQLGGRLSLISTRVKQFPILPSGTSSKMALYSFIQSGFLIRF